MQYFILQSVIVTREQDRMEDRLLLHRNAITHAEETSVQNADFHFCIQPNLPPGGSSLWLQPTVFDPQLWTQLPKWMN